ncbi:hypothetical protein Q7P37_010971 [Cladosporium fusiforme]
MPSDSPARPYRSHKSPACVICRKRKIRCHVTASGRACRFCEERGIGCGLERRGEIATGTGTATAPTGSEHLLPHAISPTKKRRLDVPESYHGTTTGTALSNLANAPDASPEESSVLMNPTMSEDISALEKYLTSQASSSNPKTRPYNVLPSKISSSSSPIVYLSVQRRRQGLATTQQPGKSQREIMEQILAPHLDEVVALYFTHLHPCFPVIDAPTFQTLWRRDRARISSPTLCAMYASALIFWRRSAALKHVPQPDMAFAWNQHVMAMQDEFLAPGIGTVCAALLDMVGRPVLGILGNIVEVGRTVALAQGLGLHRGEGLGGLEVGVRGRLWWGVVVHDVWSSIAHGTPPLVRSEFADVPFPAVAGEGQQDETDSQHTFTYLCRLTKILGQILPLVYTLQDNGNTPSLRRLECELDQWEADLPAFLQLRSGSVAMACNGTSNLLFCRLSVRLLLARLFLRDVMTSRETQPEEAKPYHQSAVREKASNVIDFVTSLSESQLGEFWLPYVSHLLVSATTILLRCTIESPDPAVRQTCLQRLRSFFAHLLWAKEACSWDLADFTLERCQEPFEKIAAACALQVTEEGLGNSQADVRGEGLAGEDGGEVARRDAGSSNVVEAAGFEDSLPVVDWLEFGIPWDAWDFLEQPLFDAFQA